MNSIDILLNELQKRIDSNESTITNFENKKNELIEIQNILYAHNLLNKEVELNELLSFSDEEIKKVLTCIDKDKEEMLYRTFTIYKPLVITYQNISARLGAFEAPQYNDAIKWLNELLKRINTYSKSFEDNNEEYVTSLRNENILYKKYYNIFNGGDLKTPIQDLDEFNKLLDDLNFTIQEKGKIKKEIGIDNYNLLNDTLNNNPTDIEEEQSENNEPKIFKEDNNVQNEEKEPETNNLEENTIEITEENNSLKEDTNTISETNREEDPTSENIEDIANKEENYKSEPEEVIIKPEDNDEEKSLSEDELIIQSVKEILNNEKDLISSIDEKEFSAYLADSLNSSNKKTIKYQIVSILLALHTELEKYNNSEGLDKNRKLYLSNIKEYLEAYHTLKNK